MRPRPLRIWKILQFGARPGQCPQDILFLTLHSPLDCCPQAWFQLSISLSPPEFSPINTPCLGSPLPSSRT